DAIEKLKSILPENDHCVTVSDPLEVVLDRLAAGQRDDPDVRYTVNRFSVINDTGPTASSHVFDLTKSMGAFMARQRGAEAIFTAKVDGFRDQVSRTSTDGLDVSIALLATQSGLSADLIDQLRQTLLTQMATLPTSIPGWVTW